MNKWRYSWKAYSIGLFIVWAIVFILVWKIDTKTQLKDVELMFYGYLVGWISTTTKFVLITRHQSKKPTKSQKLILAVLL